MWLPESGYMFAGLVDGIDIFDLKPMIIVELG